MSMVNSGDQYLIPNHLADKFSNTLHNSSISESAHLLLRIYLEMFLINFFVSYAKFKDWQF